MGDPHSLAPRYFAPMQVRRLPASPLKRSKQRHLRSAFGLGATCWMSAADSYIRIGGAGVESALWLDEAKPESECGGSSSCSEGPFVAGVGSGEVDEASAQGDEGGVEEFAR